MPSEADATTFDLGRTGPAALAPPGQAGDLIEPAAGAEGRYEVSCPQSEPVVGMRLNLLGWRQLPFESGATIQAVRPPRTEHGQNSCLSPSRDARSGHGPCLSRGARSFQ